MRNGSFVAYSCGLVALVVATACGNIPTSQVEQTAGVVLSANDIFQQLAKLTSAERTAAAESAAKMSMLDYYESLLKGASDAAVSIDGYTFSGALTELKAQKPYYESLAATFPTLASYWRATGFDPTAVVTESELTLAIRSLEGKASTSGLGLVSADCPIASSSNLRSSATLPAVGTQATPASTSVSPNLSDIPAGASYYGAYSGALQGNLYMAATPSSNAQDYIDKHTALLDTVATSTNPKSQYSYQGTMPDGTQLSQCYFPHRDNSTRYITRWRTGPHDCYSVTNIVDCDANGTVTNAYVDTYGSGTQTKVTDPNGNSSTWTNQ